MYIYLIEPIGEHEEGERYIGSTTKPSIQQRYDEHVHGFHLWSRYGNRSKLMCYELFAKYGTKGCTVRVLEELPSDSLKHELLQREAHFIRTLFPNMNKCIPLRTKAEWNKEHANRRRQRIVCDVCCKQISIDHRSSHAKSKRHLERLRTVQEKNGHPQEESSSLV